LDDAANTPREFWCYFPINEETFMNIVFGVWEYDDYFMCKPDCTGLYGFSSVQKCTTALRCIAYGASCDTYEDYLHIDESTCFETAGRFCRAVVTVFGKDYLLESWHKMQLEDFLGWLGALMHALGLEELPVCLARIVKRTYQRRVQCDPWSGGRLGLLDLACFLGMARTHNDINVLQRSPVFARDLRRDKILRWTLKSTATRITKGTTSSMVSIRSSLHCEDHSCSNLREAVSLC
jgi:hypothetical protein